MTLQRYMGFGGAMITNGDGKWVKADEHEAEIAKEYLRGRQHEVAARADVENSHIARLKADNERLRNGLEFVKKHLEVTVPDLCCVSATYRIACDALKGGDE
jgi:hypothetical protein